MNFYNKPIISFDYAIKYLLRHKKDYEIIEGFLSALLKAYGYKDVKIRALLDPESNKENKDLKRSIADLLVEDEDHNQYIIEIERTAAKHFVHKACFNSSRLVIDSLSTDQSYTNIKKIFHISLLYFIPKDVQSTLTHAKCVLYEKDDQHSGNLRIIDNSPLAHVAQNVFPEYFFISVPLFNDEVRQELDEWLYVMKHTKVREDFKSKVMQLVAERLSVLKMEDDERTEYFKYQKDRTSADDQITTSYEEGIEKGIAKGKAEGKAEIAKAMLAEGIDILTITKITGLSEDAINNLKEGE